MLENLLGVAGIALLAPLILGLSPGLRLPAVALEIVAGIVVGPAGLGWIAIDEAVEVLALLGLAFLLFLAGLEIAFDLLRGRLLRLALLAFGLSLVLAFAVGGVLRVAGLAESPLLVAVILSATALGVVVPVLKDAGETGSELGQLVIAAASIADFSAILLLSLLFSGESAGATARAVLLIGFAASVLALWLAVRGAEMSMRLSDALLRLQDTTAQIRVRAAMVALIGLAVVAEHFGLEAILGAFAAGAVVSLTDRDERMTHPEFRRKLEVVGYGVFVPAFFVTSGLRFDLDALTSSASALALVPIFVVALLVVRGLPALLVYPRLVGAQRARVAGFLQATSLPFIVTAVQIGLARELLEPATGAALVAAGLVSVLLCPALALKALNGGDVRAVTPVAPPGLARGAPGPG